MLRLKWMLVSGVPVMLAAGVAMAQVDGQGGNPSQERVIAYQHLDQVLSDDLIGMDVVDEDGSTVGTVDNLLFDTDGRIAGVVVSLGGFFGIGAKHVALAWNEIDVRLREDVAVVSFTKEQLEAAPSFKDQATIQAEQDAARAARERREGEQEPPQSMQPRSSRDN